MPGCDVTISARYGYDVRSRLTCIWLSTAMDLECMSRIVSRDDTRPLEFSAYSDWSQQTLCVPRMNPHYRVHHWLLKTLGMIWAFLELISSSIINVKGEPLTARHRDPPQSKWPWPMSWPEGLYHPNPQAITQACCSWSDNDIWLLEKVG